MLNLLNKVGVNKKMSSLKISFQVLPPPPPPPNFLSNSSYLRKNSVLYLSELKSFLSQFDPGKRSYIDLIDKWKNHLSTFICLQVVKQSSISHKIFYLWPKVEYLEFARGNLFNKFKNLFPKILFRSSFGLHILILQIIKIWRPTQ